MKLLFLLFLHNSINNIAVDFLNYRVSTNFSSACILNKLLTGSDPTQYAVSGSHINGKPIVGLLEPS